MSADNCVAILATKIYPEAKEYQEWRVCVAHAIGNVFKNDCYMHQYFKNSPVFEMYEDADGHSRQFELYDNISEFIHNFEENKRKKKESKVKGLEKFMEEDLPE